jgi:hypothetical protein
MNARDEYLVSLEKELQDSEASLEPIASIEDHWRTAKESDPFIREKAAIAD